MRLPRRRIGTHGDRVEQHRDQRHLPVEPDHGGDEADDGQHVGAAVDGLGQRLADRRRVHGEARGVPRRRVARDGGEVGAGQRAGTARPASPRSPCSTTDCTATACPYCASALAHTTPTITGGSSHSTRAVAGVEAVEGLLDDDGVERGQAGQQHGADRRPARCRAGAVGRCSRARRRTSAPGVVGQGAAWRGGAYQIAAPRGGQFAELGRPAGLARRPRSPRARSTSARAPRRAGRARPRRPGRDAERQDVAAQQRELRPRHRRRAGGAGPRGRRRRRAPRPAATGRAAPLGPASAEDAAQRRVVIAGRRVSGLRSAASVAASAPDMRRRAARPRRFRRPAGSRAAEAQQRVAGASSIAHQPRAAPDSSAASGSTARSTPVSRHQRQRAGRVGRRQQALDLHPDPLGREPRQARAPRRGSPPAPPRPARPGRSAPGSGRSAAPAGSPRAAASPGRPRSAPARPRGPRARRNSPRAARRRRATWR